MRIKATRLASDTAFNWKTMPINMVRNYSALEWNIRRETRQTDETNYDWQQEAIHCKWKYTQPALSD